VAWQAISIYHASPSAGPASCLSRTIAGLTPSPLERGRDPLPRVTSLRMALPICCPSKVAALRRDCVCIKSFGPLKCEFAQPRCGRYAGRSRSLGVDSPTFCMLRGTGLWSLKLVIPLFSRPRHRLQCREALPPQHRASGVASNSSPSKTAVLAGSASCASLTGADGPKSACSDSSDSTRAVLQDGRPHQIIFEKHFDRQLPEGLPNLCERNTKIS